MRLVECADQAQAVAASQATLADDSNINAGTLNPHLPMRRNRSSIGWNRQKCGSPETHNAALAEYDR
jgi:hypothetical protein